MRMPVGGGPDNTSNASPDGSGKPDPTFSVIINNYNYRTFLPEAVESILRQTCEDYELIIVDDGSTDGSVAYLESLAVDLVLVRTDRRGQARACLEAFRHARGRYIYFLDADDVAFEGLLSAAALAIVDEPAKVQFRLVPTDADGKPFADPMPAITTDHDACRQRDEIYRTGMPLSPPTSGNIFHRRVLEAVGDIPYETAIDGITLLAAPFLGAVVSIPESLGAYRVHGLGHSAHANPLDAGRIARDRERFSGRISHLNEIIGTLGLSARPLRDAEGFFYFWDCVTLEAAVKGQAIGLRAVLAFVARLLAEHGLTRFSLRKLAWLIIATAAPGPVKLRYVRARMNPWPRRRVQNPPALENR